MTSIARWIPHSFVQEALHPHELTVPGQLGSFHAHTSPYELHFLAIHYVVRCLTLPLCTSAGGVGALSHRPLIV